MKLYDFGLLAMTLTFLTVTVVAEFQDGGKLADTVFEPEEVVKVKVIK